LYTFTPEILTIRSNYKTYTITIRDYDHDSIGAVIETPKTSGFCRIPTIHLPQCEPIGYDTLTSMLNTSTEAAWVRFCEEYEAYRLTDIHVEETARTIDRRQRAGESTGGLNIALSGSKQSLRIKQDALTAATSNLTDAIHTHQIIQHYTPLLFNRALLNTDELARIRYVFVRVPHVSLDDFSVKNTVGGNFFATRPGVSWDTWFTPYGVPFAAREVRATEGVFTTWFAGEYHNGLVKIPDNAGHGRVRRLFEQYMLTDGAKLCATWLQARYAAYMLESSLRICDTLAGGDGDLRGDKPLMRLLQARWGTLETLQNEVSQGFADYCHQNPTVLDEQELMSLYQKFSALSAKP
jgi:hypothetical protein